MSDLLHSLRLFVSLSDQLNFSRVARQLHVSHSTIARRMDELEAHFGARLFLRSTRRLSLTREGERLLDHARAIVGQLDEAETELGSPRAVRGLVRIGVTTALGLHYAERASGLHAAHPGLTLELVIGDWLQGLGDAGLDLTVHVGVADGAAGVVGLGSVRRLLVASPAYLAEHGAPGDPAALREHRCITYPYGTERPFWDVGGMRLRVDGPFRSNSSEAVHRAVRSGLGIALLPVIQVRADLDNGVLQPVLPDAEVAPVEIVMAHRFSGVRLPSAVRVVREFLTDAFPGEDMPQSPPYHS